MQKEISHSADQEFSLVKHLFGQPLMEIEEQFFMSDDLTPPRFPIKSLQLLKTFLGEIEPVPVQVLVIWHPANRSFFGSGAPPRSINNPFQNSHIFSVTGPNEIPVIILPEPIHMEYSRSFGQFALHRDPVAKIFSHVIPAEREHRHRIPPHFPNLAGRCSCHF